jgi:Transposase IS116/IS110/IS902 family
MLTPGACTKPCLRILNKLWTALADPAGVTAHRAGGFERIGWILDDWDAARTNLVDVEQRMTTALDQLGLTGLVTSIDGLSPVGAAAILAETGDLTRFTSARAIVKLAGLAPRERLSGTPHRRLAGRVGLPAPQQRLRRPVPAPHHPRPEQVEADPGPNRDRRRATGGCPGSRGIWVAVPRLTPPVG